MSLSLNRQEPHTAISLTYHRHPFFFLFFFVSEVVLQFFFVFVFFLVLYPFSSKSVLMLKSELPRTSQIGSRCQSGWSAKRRRAPLGPCCPPARLCSGRTGTAGGSRRCSRLLPLRLLGPQLRSYSGRARILNRSTGRRRLIKASTIPSSWHSLIQMNHLKYTHLMKPVSFSHPTLSLHCEINSTPFNPPSSPLPSFINKTKSGACKQIFFSQSTSSLPDKNT